MAKALVVALGLGVAGICALFVISQSGTLWGLLPPAVGLVVVGMIGGFLGSVAPFATGDAETWRA